jgi:hypothetical protein
LHRGQRSGCKRAQQADGRIVETERGLPDREQHVDHIGEPVVQRVRAAGDREHIAAAEFGR